MAAVTPRFCWQNFAQLGSGVLSATSQNTSYPVGWLADQLPSKVWRSLLGWNIVEGFNDRINFTEGTTGDANAILAVGNYATGALLATHIQTQMDAAATDNTYTVTYSVSTNKFTIARATGTDTFGLEWDTGPNKTRSIAACIGFSDAADDTGSTSYEADTVSYKSRERVVIDLGSALEVKMAYLTEFNFAGATVTVAGNATDAWTAPSFSEALTEASDESNKVTYFSSGQTYRYWMIEIDDVSTNTAGYSELGVVTLASYLQASRDILPGFVVEHEEMSGLTFADQGAHFYDEKPSRRIWQVAFSIVPDAEKQSFETMANFLKRGRSFVMALDPQNNPTESYCVFLPEGLKFQHDPAQTRMWRIGFEMAEAVG